jgi:hypothetical protein
MLFTAAILIGISGAQVGIERSGDSRGSPSRSCGKRREPAGVPPLAAPTTPPALSGLDRLLRERRMPRMTEQARHQP